LVGVHGLCFLFVKAVEVVEKVQIVLREDFRLETLLELKIAIIRKVLLNQHLHESAVLIASADSQRCTKAPDKCHDEELNVMVNHRRIYHIKELLLRHFDWSFSLFFGIFVQNICL